MGHGGNTVDAHAGSRQGHRGARPAGRRRSGADHLGRAVQAQGRHLPAARRRPATRWRARARPPTARIQWGQKIVEPIFEAKDDNEIMYRLAVKLGFADRMFKNIKVENNVPVAEDILREINRGGWSTGYCGQSPERLKLHMANQKDFDLVTLRAADGPCKGDYYGLPWPCWGTPEFKHPGTPILYNTHLHVKDGGGTFRARFGVERVVKTKAMVDGKEVEQEVRHNLLGRRLLLGGLGDPGWISRVHLRRAQAARLGQGPQPMPSGPPSSASAAPTPMASPGRSTSPAASSACASTHGVMHYGNGKARAVAFGLPDAVPVHREPIYSPRPELVARVSDAAQRTPVPRAQRRLRRAEGGCGEGHRQGVPAHPRPRAAWSSTRAAARRPAPTSGSPSCSRTCSSRSILPMRPSAASGTALGSGCYGPAGWGTYNGPRTPRPRRG